MKTTIALLSILIPALYSCSSYRTIYAASPPCNPTFKEKGESQAAIYYSDAGNNDIESQIKANGVDVHTAYAFTKKFAATFTYSQRNEIDEYKKNHIGYKGGTLLEYNRKFMEIGGGYFVPLSSKKKSVFNLYAGMGIGNFSFTDKSGDGNYNKFYNRQMTKLFVMPSINFMLGKIVHFGFGFKYSFVKYKKMNTSYDNLEFEQFEFDKLNKRKFFEPSYHILFIPPKIQWLKLELIASAAKDISQNELQYLIVRPGNTSIGFNIDVAKMYKALKK